MTNFKKFLIAVSMLLSACALDTQELGGSSNPDTSDLPYSFSQFSDIPIPEKATMNLDKTAIFGRENDWVGKITFSAPYSVGGVFDFYMSEMPKFGWEEITSVRGANSVLTYNRDTRVALIQLTPARFNGGTEVVLTMSPAPQKKHSKKTETFGSKKTFSTRPHTKQVVKENTNTNFNSQPSNVETLPLTQSSIFVAPQAQKAAAGSLGLGEASNLNYKSSSPGVGQPPKF